MTSLPVNGAFRLVAMGHCACAEFISCDSYFSYWLILITLIIAHVYRLQCPLANNYPFIHSSIHCIHSLTHFIRSCNPFHPFRPFRPFNQCPIRPFRLFRPFEHLVHIIHSFNPFNSFRPFLPLRPCRTFIPFHSFHPFINLLSIPSKHFIHASTYSFICPQRSRDRQTRF